MALDWSRRGLTDCPHCGAPSSALALSCPHCGASKPTRAAVGIAAIAGLAVVVVAIAIAALVLRRPAAPAPVDVAALSQAMQDCETEAARQPSTLYFLVVPMTSKAPDEEQWQAKSLNDIGNGILLSSDVALEGLKSGALALASEEYVFNVRDRAGALYNWKGSTGIARLTIPNADRIDGFNIQFQTRSKTSDAAWGSEFVRQSGTCYWVNAIIGN
jgi:hypothetical protein